jgi:hypothetical protein
MFSRLESEPSVVWNGWGVAFCLAAFILGIVAASDNGSSMPQATELRVRPENAVAADPKLVSRK